jgi:hypothetical protein
MAVRKDCRHYSSRTLHTGEQVERCRLDVNQAVPFACPEGCLFFEARSISAAGWAQPRTEDERP